MRFAYLIMGDFDKTDKAEIHNGAAQIVGVSNMEEAVIESRRLMHEGVNCIELCGAFGADGARMIIETTGNKIPIGYVTHLPEQDDVYASVFSIDD